MSKHSIKYIILPNAYGDLYSQHGKAIVNVLC